MKPVTRIARRPRARRQRRITTLLVLCTLGAGSLTVTTAAAGPDSPPGDAGKPTVVLVHGAWADASSWAHVTQRLQSKGYSVVAPANPLRSLSGDSAYLKTFLDTIDGPIVLVGHSYGASVATNAAAGDPDVRALVFVNGSVPAEGETVAELAGPDSALSVADPTQVFSFVPAALPPGPGTDLYLKEATFLDEFATGIHTRQARTLWASQRPVTLGALNEPSGAPAWEQIPSWYVIGTRDKVIPLSAQQEMAAKAGSTVVRFEAGHLGLITNPAPVVRAIQDADRATR